MTSSVQRWLLIILVVAVSQLAYWSTFYPRRARRVNGLNREVSELDQRIDGARTAQTGLDRFRREMIRLRAEHRKLDLILPPTLSGQDLRTVLQARADQTGVQIQRVDLRAIEDRETHAVLSAGVEVAGSPAEVLEFLLRLLNSPFISAVFDLTAERVGPSEWRTTFRLEIPFDQVASKNVR